VSPVQRHRRARPRPTHTAAYLNEAHAPQSRYCAPVTKPTLTYFDIPTSRGEECRLALFIAEVPFTDERLTRAQWDARKAQAPFGALPMLSQEGRPTLAQSNAILRMVGSQHGLLPADPWESARHEAVMCSVEELRAKLSPANRIKDPAEKKQAIDTLATGPLPEWAGQIEKQIIGPFLGGTALSVADLKLFVVMTPLLTGRIDHIPPATFDPFPGLLALVAAVKAHPKIVAWSAR
jgi:prostaglandin-H2 D-isomerase / glutathione transferase